MTKSIGSGKAAAVRLRIGISSCLLGEKVRYDGGHKKAASLIRALARYVEWVPVCPEQELGLGVPRPAMRLEGSAAAPRLITIESRVDHTQGMARFARRRVGELAALALDGYIFKSNSPSCGTTKVPVVTRGRAVRRGVGIFARQLMSRLPGVPVGEESELADPASRARFLEKARACRRRRELAGR